ncbi:MAG: SOS response-associated peptidase [Acidobacteriota bacterium]|nr:SOS response-associated peptidase [Acidobacteriota bacterium]
MMRWGLIPQFAKSLADFKGLANINAKAETVTSKAVTFDANQIHAFQQDFAAMWTRPDNEIVQ